MKHITAFTALILAAAACKPHSGSASAQAAASAAHTAASSSAPPPAPSKSDPAQEARMLSDLLAEFDRENEAAAEQIQQQFTEQTTASEAAQIIRNEAQTITAHIQRLRELPLTHPQTAAIRDQLIRAYESDRRTADQTAAYFAAPDAAGPPAEDDTDSDALETEAKNRLAQLLAASAAQ